MTDLAREETRLGLAWTLACWKRASQRVWSATVGYGLAVVSVVVAVGLSLALQHYDLRPQHTVMLSLGVAIATWYGGLGPSALVVLLSTASYDYFFVEPIHSFDVSPRELPYFAIFAMWVLVVAWFSMVSRNMVVGLRQTRDRLQREVEQRARREEEIGRLNQDLARRAAELESANKELESFAYSVSHDLRAPLRHVIGFSELLQRRASASLDEKSRHYVQTMCDSARRMGELIDDLLAFSRIARAETTNMPVNLEHLAREVADELGQDTKGRDIVWQIGALPVCQGDRSMLRLVMVNLLSNAIKFTRMRRPAEIEIGCIERAHEIEIFVRDNGAGFDMRHVGKLFGVFQRLHPTAQFEGTGIGLATVQRIIHRHGGTVRAEGAVDRGATVYFSLPRTTGPGTRGNLT